MNSRALGSLEQRAALVAVILRLPWLTPDQGALVAGVHPSTCRRACREGHLKAVKVNGRTKNCRSDTASMRKSTHPKQTR